MNFTEALPDITASYAGSYLTPDLYISDNQPDYFSPDSIAMCGSNILENVNHKSLNNRNTCAVASAYPGELDMKKQRDTDSYSRGLEGFVPGRETRPVAVGESVYPIKKRVSWGPSVVHDYEPFASCTGGGCSRSSGGFLDMGDNTVVLLLFAFILYMIYCMMNMKTELDHMKRSVYMMHYNNGSHSPSSNTSPMNSMGPPPSGL
jgi:hypothetical protein